MIEFRSYSNPVFSMEDKKGYEEHVIFSAVIPKNEEDLEIELPEIFLEGKPLSPQNLNFKWNNRWILSPINGLVKIVDL